MVQLQNRVGAYSENAGATIQVFMIADNLIKGIINGQTGLIIFSFN